jgi:hypothetical protein
MSESSATHHKNRRKSRLLPLPAQASGGGYPAADEEGARGGGGGAGEGAGPGARGGTEDDDKGLGLSEDFFFKCGRRLSSVPTCTSSSSSSCYIAQFHITKIPRPVSNSPPTSKFNLRPTFLLLKSAHLSIYLQPLLLSVVVVVVLELLQLLLLLLFLQETELLSLNIVRQSFTDLSARLYIITEFCISQKAVDSFLIGKSQSSALVSSIFLPFLQVSE